MVLLLALAAALPLLLGAARRAGCAPSPSGRTQWDGRALRPLAMSAVEQRFAARFPGAIARFTDGERVLVLRSVRPAHAHAAPGRRLLPRPRLPHRARRSSSATRSSGCGAASRPSADGQRLRVCERIVERATAAPSSTRRPGSGPRTLGQIDRPVAGRHRGGGPVKKILMFLLGAGAGRAARRRRAGRCWRCARSRRSRANGRRRCARATGSSEASVPTLLRWATHPLLLPRLRRPPRRAQLAAGSAARRAHAGGALRTLPRAARRARARSRWRSTRRGSRCTCAAPTASTARCAWAPAPSR